jgi:hypothetical protein
MPKRIAKRAYRSLGVISAANIGAHANFKHHAFQGHDPVLP